MAPGTTSPEPHAKRLKTDDQHHHEHDIKDIDRRLTQSYDVHPETPILSDSMPKDDLHPPNDELKQEDTLAGCALRNLRVSLRRVTEDE